MPGIWAETMERSGWRNAFEKNSYYLVTGKLWDIGKRNFPGRLQAFWHKQIWG